MMDGKTSSESLAGGLREAVPNSEPPARQQPSPSSSPPRPPLGRPPLLNRSGQARKANSGGTAVLNPPAAGAGAVERASPFLSQSLGDSGRSLTDEELYGASRKFKLASYTSEPPESLQVMREWAQELLQQQQQQQQQEQQQEQQRQQGMPEQPPAGKGASFAFAPPPLNLDQANSAARAEFAMPNSSPSRLHSYPPSHAEDLAAAEAGNAAGAQSRSPTAAGTASRALSPSATLPGLDDLMQRTFSGLKPLPAGAMGSPTKVPSTPRAMQRQQQSGVRRRLGIQLLSDPLAEQRGVHNHKLAGDLFLGVKGGKGQFHIPPLPPEVAGAVLELDKRTKAPPKRKEAAGQGIQRKDAGEKQDEDEPFDFEIGEDLQKEKFYKRARFWKISLSVLFTVVFLVTGVFMAVWQDDERVENTFQWWRLLIFIGTLVPIWWIGTFVGKLVIWITERRYFTTGTVLYFVYVVRKPLANMVRSGLLMASWAACMFEPSFNDEQKSAEVERYEDAYLIIVKLLGCLLLFFTAELLKVLFAKMIASKFNRESHIKKMRAALQQEHYLHALLQPRANQWREELEPEGDDKYGLDEDPSTKQGGLRISGPPSLARASAPNPKLTHKPSLRSLGSLLHLSMPRPWQGRQSLESHRRLSRIEEDLEAEHPSPVEVRIETSSGPSTPRGSLGHRSHSSSLTSSPSRPGPAGQGPPSPQVTVVRRSLSGSSMRRRSNDSSRQGPAGDEAAPKPGLLRQGGQAIAGLVRRSNEAGAPSVDGVRSISSAAALKRSTAMPHKPPPKGAISLSGETLMGKNPATVAAKMARVEKHIRNNSLQVTFYDELSQANRKEKMTSENDAKRIAFYIFYNVKTDFERPYLTVDDLEAFLPEKDAQGAYMMLDKDGNGKVTLAECATAVMNVFKEREYLAASLRDTKTIVKKLAFMIGVGLHICFFFVYLLILGLDAWKVFLAIVPLLGALSFALGSTVKQAVDNSVFLFVTHPFDVGDIVILNDSWHRVEEITLPCTVMLRTADSAKIYYPNTMLLNTPLHNVTMSPPLAEIMSFIVDACTPLSVLEEVKQAVATYTTEHSHDYVGGKVSAWFDIAKDVVRPNKLSMKFKVEYNYNALNPRCFPTRGALIHFILNQLAERKVEVTNPTQPVALHGLGALQAGLATGGSVMQPSVFM